MSEANGLPETYTKLYAEPIEKAQQGWTFAEVYGEEAAIHAGIATDPDAAPLREDLRGARPLADVDIELLIAR